MVSARLSFSLICSLVTHLVRSQDLNNTVIGISFVPGTHDIDFDADSRALIDKDRLAQVPMTDAERKERLRDLLTKQTYEAAKLENSLRANEIDSVNDKLNVSEIFFVIQLLLNCHKSS